MRSRRTLSRPAVAVAAVLIPAALLSGTAATTTAYATDSPSPSASASASAPSESASPSASPSSSPSASASVSPSASASPSAPASPSPSGTKCPIDQKDSDEYLFATAAGENNKLVEGGTWRNATIEVENRADVAVKNVRVGVAKLAYREGDDGYAEYPEFIDLQQRDAKSGEWVEISWDDDKEKWGGLGTVDLAPGETVTFSLRLKAKANYPRYAYLDPASKVIGWGYLQPTLPGAASDPSVCAYAKEWHYNVYKSGTDTGNGATPTPTSGTGGNTPTPQTGSTAPVTPTPVGSTPTGDLAHTGSSSALPVIAGLGAVAVGLGAGAVYVVRRRRDGTDAV